MLRCACMSVYLFIYLFIYIYILSLCPTYFHGLPSAWAFPSFATSPLFRWVIALSRLAVAKTFKGNTHRLAELLQWLGYLRLLGCTCKGTHDQAMAQGSLKLQLIWWRLIDSCQDDVAAVISWGVSERLPGLQCPAFGARALCLLKAPHRAFNHRGQKSKRNIRPKSIQQELGVYPGGSARHPNVSRQKLTPHCLAAIFDSQLPSPKLSPKMPPIWASPPTRKGAFGPLSQLGNASLFTKCLFTFFVPLKPPTSNQQSDGFPLEFLLKGPQTDIQRTSNRIANTQPKLRTNSPKIANKQSYEEAGVSM